MIMKLTYNIRTLLAIAVITFFTACGKSNKQGRMVPKDAVYVVHADGNALAGKITWDDIKQYDLIKQVTGDDKLPAYIVDIFNNPDKSGIDLKKDLVFFTVADEMGGYIAFEGSLKDAAKFGMFNIDVTEGGFESEKSGVKYITAAPVIVGYTKEKFVYVIDAPQVNPGAYLNSERRKRASRDIQQAIEGIFGMSEGKSLGGDSRFTALMNDKADLHMWVNTGVLVNKNLDESLPLSLNNFTEDNLTAVSVTFDNGKIALKTKLYMGKELFTLIKKYRGTDVNEDMVKRLPVQNPMALLAMNFKPQGIKEIIKLMGVDGMINSQLRKEGMPSLDDFIKANKGDILMALTGLSIKKDSLNYPGGISYSKPEPDFVFAVAINDKESFNKLIKWGQLEGGRSEYEPSAKAPEFAFGANDQYFVFAKNKDAVDDYLAGKNNSTGIIKSLTGAPITGYADIQAMMKAAGTSAINDSTERAMYDLSLQLWDNVILKGGNIEDGALVINFDINLKDKNTGSLKQLNAYGIKMVKLQEQKTSNDMMRYYPPSTRDAEIKEITQPNR
jgi:Domain of unknown function (DUF4836)